MGFYLYCLSDFRSAVTYKPKKAGAGSQQELYKCAGNVAMSWIFYFAPVKENIHSINVALSLSIDPYLFTVIFTAHRDYRNALFYLYYRIPQLSGPAKQSLSTAA